ncbi:MAG: glycoside hydrolase family 97 catalytic domain-containing protein [Kiritimatiellia bacterium]
MNKSLVSCLGVLVLAGSSCFGGEAQPVSAVSPDGKNEIRLWTDPLAYEVRRGGKVVAAKTAIGLRIDGACLSAGAAREVRRETRSGEETTPVYKKAKISLAANETFADFGAWGVRLAARDDGVAYRFETKLPGTVRVDGEKAAITVPSASARCWVNFTGSYGCEETIPEALPAREVRTVDSAQKKSGRSMVYLPFAYAADGAFVVVTESDVRDYPIWNLVGTNGADAVAGSVRFDAKFAGWPKQTRRLGGWGENQVDRGGRWVRVTEHADWLVQTSGTRTFPWRAFILADTPDKVCAADLVRALAAPQAEGDFSWVKPGKVAWDWWNCFDNSDPKAKNGGCTTKTYERFIDFAAASGVEYVIFDEGWSERLNIWKFHPEVDVPHLIDYANKRGVGIILWMAWAQTYGEEEKVAAHFAQLGAKGFKVDFMDRGDAEVANFLEKFAAACAKHRMLVDYHGAYRPVGLQRKYPNVVNYEGIHGLEQLKWFPGGAAAETAMMASDVRAFYLRLSAGPMDYTPGAMLNHAVGAGYKGDRQFPGSVGTRCRQMAMMVLYEAPLQMLCDSPTNYERNRECFDFMAKTPVVWADTVGVGGDPDSLAAVARRANDGAWYAAAITDVKAREFALDTAFLGHGTWRAEIFRDGADADKLGTSYVHERNVAVQAGSTLRFRLAPGGGCVVRFAQ